MINSVESRASLDCNLETDIHHLIRNLSNPWESRSLADLSGFLGFQVESKMARLCA